MKKTMSIMGTCLMAGMIGYGTYYYMNNKKFKEPMIKQTDTNQN